MSNRNYGLDIFRIMCCIGVLIYHVVDDVLGTSTLTYLLYYGASFCVPGFFLLSGYLINERKNIEIKYYEKKITSTAIKLFYWILFLAVVRFLHTGEILDIQRNYLDTVGSGGILPVAWFLFTYCILIYISYFVVRLMNYFSGGGCFLLIVSVLLIGILALGYRIDTDKTQSRWFDLYFSYFIVGMALKEVEGFMQRINSRIKISIEMLLFICCSLIYWQEVGHAGQFILPGGYYGKLYYSIWLITMFLLIKNIEVKKKTVQEVLEKLSRNTFSVFLGHYPVLIYLTSSRPLQNVQEAVIMVFFLFFLWESSALLFSKMPLLRKLV